MIEQKPFPPFPDRRIGPWWFGADGKWVHAEDVWKNELKEMEIKDETNADCTTNA